LLVVGTSSSDIPPFENVRENAEFQLPSRSWRICRETASLVSIATAEGKSLWDMRSSSRRFSKKEGWAMTGDGTEKPKEQLLNVSPASTLRPQGQALKLRFTE